MLTNKEAIEMIASIGKYLTDGNPIWKTEPIKEATDMAIKALQQTAWIPVEERLPENGVDDIVLVSVGYDMEFGRCNNNGEWLIWSSGWVHCDKVLAWMPLPEPYRGGDDSDD